MKHKYKDTTVVCTKACCLKIQPHECKSSPKIFYNHVGENSFSLNQQPFLGQNISWGILFMSEEDNHTSSSANWVHSHSDTVGKAMQTERENRA